MTPDTGDLIRRLAAAGAPAPPLQRPWIRTGIWCATSLPTLWLLYLVWPHGDTTALLDRRFAVEQVAALATALVAAAAAFTTVIPAHSRAILLGPLVPAAVWMATLGRLCARDWPVDGQLRFVVIHWGCFPATVVVGIVPALVLIVMLRRGAPLTPRLTTGFAALAVAGMANFGVRFVHPFDASFVVLAWHVVAVFALSAAAASCGDRVFNWRKAITASVRGHT
jgi:hypothetical protein